MQRLILMRHAKAERDAASGRDRDRPLSSRGHAEAALIARTLAERGWRPDTALVSAAVRTRETWETASDAFGDVELHVEDALYDAEAEAIRALIEGVEEQAGCLIVVAHNPGVQQLALDLLTESAASPALLDQMAAGFPTAAAALFGVDAAGRCVYEGFLTPKGLGGGE